jgi:hypothetical protein
LVKSKYTDAVEVEAPCPPVVSSAKGDEIDPVAVSLGRGEDGRRKRRRLSSGPSSSR